MALADPEKVSRKRRPYLAKSVISNPELFTRVNKALDKEAKVPIDDIW